MNPSEFNRIGKALYYFILLKKAAEIVQAYKDKEGVELHEMEIAQLFTLSYQKLQEDEFSIDLIFRVYERIQNKERHNRIEQALKEWAAENDIDLDSFLKILRTESA